jgi:glycosyltransferase involved in cell wall biosynthesis
MRLLYLSAFGGMGGAARVLLDLLVGMRSRGHEVRLILGEAGPLHSNVAAAGIDAEIVPMPERLAAFGESGQSPASMAASAPAAGAAAITYLSALRASVDRWSPSLIHSNTLKTHVLGARLHRSAPIVWHLHDYVGSRPLTSGLLRWHRRFARGAIANSASVAADAKAALPGLPIWTVPNAVALERFQHATAPANLDALSGLDPAPAGTIRVGLIATFAWWKGHDVFLQALATLPPSLGIRGYIIGGAIYRNGLRQVSAVDLHDTITRHHLRDRVGLTGYVEDTASVLSSLDIVVHASTRPEPFGLVIAEAMAAGKAVIVSAAGGAAEIVSADRDALVYRPGDLMALASCIRRLAEDAALRRRLGAAAANAAGERFNPGRFLDAIESAYGDGLRGLR